MTRQGDAIAITVKPRSTRAGVTVGAEGEIIVRVHAPAAEGAANRECAAVLADAIGVPKSAVQIVRGGKSRTKQLAIVGLTAAQVRARLPARKERRR